MASARLQPTGPAARHAAAIWRTTSNVAEIAQILRLESDEVDAGGTISLTWTEAPWYPPWNLSAVVLHPPNDGVGIPLWLGPYMGFTEPEPPIIWNLEVPGDLPRGDYSLVFTYGSEPLSYAAPIHVAGQGRPPNSFEGWRAPPPDTPHAKKRPCSAAVRAFGLDPDLDSSQTMDRSDIQLQFENAISLYNLNHEDQPARVGESGVGMIPVLSWLANQGGSGPDAVSKQFVFATDEDRQIWRKETRTFFPNETDRWGTERRLYSEMIRTFEANGRKLTPGDIFYLALEQRDGNATEAVLLAHNTLRSLARVNDGPFTEVHTDLAFFETHIEALIDPEPLGRGQNAGATYHVFTTMTLEMYARGNWSLNTLATYTIDRLGQFMRDEIQDLARIINRDPDLELPETRSAISVFANQVEQFYRKYKTASPDDPDKYCYNVIGSQLGAWLYRTLTAGEAQPVDRPATRRAVIPHYQQHVMSPANITWTGAGHTMTLDQETQSLTGYYPLVLMPFYEADTDTWGVSWLDLLGEAYTVTMEATQAGTVHMLSVGTGTDGAPAGARALPIPLQAGDTVTVDIEPDAPVDGATLNGSEVIQPVVVEVKQDNLSAKLRAAIQTGPLQDGEGGTTLPSAATMAAVAGLALVIGAMAVAKRRRR